MGFLIANAGLPVSPEKDMWGDYHSKSLTIDSAVALSGLRMMWRWSPFQKSMDGSRSSFPGAPAHP
jgi:hypothetical protein